MATTSSATFADTKAHYHLLDGLRGVAALIVMWYHVFEGYAFAGGTMIESFNHGYLAVDFFSCSPDSLSAMLMMTDGEGASP